MFILYIQYFLSTVRTYPSHFILHFVIYFLSAPVLKNAEGAATAVLYF